MIVATTATPEYLNTAISPDTGGSLHTPPTSAVPPETPVFAALSDTLWRSAPKRWRSNIHSCFSNRVLSLVFLCFFQLLDHSEFGEALGVVGGYKKRSSRPRTNCGICTACGERPVENQAQRDAAIMPRLFR